MSSSSLPSLARASSASLLRAALRGLQIDAFDNAGYDDALYLLQMGEAQVEQLIKDVAMKPGHASKFRDYLKLEYEAWHTPLE